MGPWSGIALGLWDRLTQGKMAEHLNFSWNAKFYFFIRGVSHEKCLCVHLDNLAICVRNPLFWGCIWAFHRYLPGTSGELPSCKTQVLDALYWISKEIKGFFVAATEVRIYSLKAVCTHGTQEVRVENHKLVLMSICLNLKVYLWVFMFHFCFQLSFTVTRTQPLLW